MAIETVNGDTTVVTNGLKTYVVTAYFARTMIIRATDSEAAEDLARDEGIMRTMDCSLNPLNWVATEVGE